MAAISSAWRKRCPANKSVLPRDPSNPTWRSSILRRSAEIAHKARRAAHRRQCVRDTDFAERVSSWAPISSSTRRPSTSMAKAARSAASCSAPRNTSWKSCALHSQYRPLMSPFNAWMMLKGLETLALARESPERRRRQVADYLAGQGRIRRVIYPHREDHPDYAIAKRQMKAGSTLVCLSSMPIKPACSGL